MRWPIVIGIPELSPTSQPATWVAFFVAVDALKMLIRETFTHLSALGVSKLFWRHRNGRSILKEHYFTNGSHLRYLLTIFSGNVAWWCIIVFSPFHCYRLQWLELIVKSSSSNVANVARCCISVFTVALINICFSDHVVTGTSIMVGIPEPSPTSRSVSTNTLFRVKEW